MYLSFFQKLFLREREREREREIISLSFFLDDENHDHVPLLVLDSAANDYHVIIFFVYKLSDVA